MRICICVCCILCLDPSSLCDSTWSNHQAQTLGLWLQGHRVHGQGNDVVHAHTCISYQTVYNSKDSSICVCLCTGQFMLDISASHMLEVPLMYVYLLYYTWYATTLILCTSNIIMVTPVFCSYHLIIYWIGLPHVHTCNNFFCSPLPQNKILQVSDHPGAFVIATDGYSRLVSNVIVFTHVIFKQ